VPQSVHVGAVSLNPVLHERHCVGEQVAQPEGQS